MYHRVMPRTHRFANSKPPLFVLGYINPSDPTQYIEIGSDAGVPTMRSSVQPPMTSPLAFTAGQAFSAGVNLQGATPVSLVLATGAAWTAADITFQTSADGTTWVDVYDMDGLPVTAKIAAGRSVTIEPARLRISANWIRLRSGTPTTPVNQVAATSVSLVAAIL